jgi:GNAT superfamily N-acetyltransferase
VSVREATEDDVDEILALITELAEFEELAGHVVCTTDDLRRDLFGPDAVVRVALVVDDEGGSVAGMALWFPSFSTFLGRTGIWLEDLFVREPYRKRGYGKALLGHLRSQTGGRVEWEVLDWNQRAIDFYGALGAAPVTGWTKYRWV